MLHLLYALFIAISNAAEIGPIPTIAADGETVVKLLVVADDPTEQISVAIEGQVKQIEPIAGGYLVHWVPDAVTTQTTVPFEVTVSKGEASETLSKEVTVTPPTTGEIGFTFTAPTVSSGSSVDVTFRYAGTAGFGQGHRRPLVKCTIGDLTNLHLDGTDTWRATYTPPANLEAPQIAVLTAIDSTAPETVYGAAPIAITVREVLSFDTLPDASTTVVVGEETFGPIIASPAGTVSVPIETHPAVPTAKMTAVHPDGRKKKQKVPLGFTSSDTVAVAPLPTHAPTGHSFNTYAWCFKPNSAPCDGRKITWFASAGKVIKRSASKNGPSVAVATVGEKQLNLQATYRASKATALLTASAPPLNIGLTLDPPALTETARRFSATASLKTPGGNASAGITARLMQDNAVVTKRAKRNGNSTTVGYRKDRSAAEAVVQAQPVGAPTGLPETKMVGWPGRDYAFLGTNAAHIPVTFGVTDAFGIGVPDVMVTLQLQGPAMLRKAKLKSDKHGLIKVPYTLTGQPGLVVFSAKGDHVQGSTALWIGPSERPVPDLRTTGTTVDEALVTQWAQRAPSAVIGPAIVIANVEIPDEIALPTTAEKSVADTSQVDTSNETSLAKTKDAPKEQRWVAGRVNPVRIRTTFVTGSPTITQTPDTIGETMAPTLDTEGQAMGVLGSVDLWLPDGNWGIEVEAKAVRLETPVESTNTVTMPIEVWAGFRYKRVVSGPFSVSGGLDLYSGSGEIISGTLNDANPVQIPMTGGRLSAEARLNIGGTFLRLRATETLVPYPVLTTAEAMLDVDIPNSVIDLSIGAVKEIRSATYSVGDGALGTTRDAILFSAGIVVPLL